MRTAAVVLRRIPFGETSWIVHALTETDGTLAMLARGARRPGSPLASGVEPLTLSEIVVSVRSGRELQNLTQASPIAPHPNLGRDLERHVTAQACAEAALRFLRESGPAPGVFTLLRDGLGSLEAGEDCAPALWRFLAGFAEELGWGLALDHCAQCGSEEVSDSRSLSIEAGGFLCPDCERANHAHPLPVSTATILRSLGIPGNAPPSADPAEAEAIEDLLYGHLCRHAGVLPRLETRTLLREARAP